LGIRRFRVGHKVSRGGRASFFIAELAFDVPEDDVDEEKEGVRGLPIEKNP
jgi:hypothetical protein